MPGEVDEQVEIVGRDQRRDARVVEPGEHAPRDARLGGGILAGPLRVVEVRVDLERVGIVRGEHATDERGQRDVRVGRQVADAQRAVRRIHGAHDRTRRHVALDLLRPRAVRREDLLRRAGGVELQRRETVRGGRREAGVRRERAVVRGDRGVDAAGLLQQVAEVVVRGRAHRVERERALERFDRAIGVSGALARVAEVDPRGRRARVERDRRLERAHRLACAARAVERRAQVDAIGRIARRERDRPLERIDRGRPAARGVRDHADAVPRRVQARVALQRVAVARLRLGRAGPMQRARLLEDFRRRHRGGTGGTILAWRDTTTGGRRRAARSPRRSPPPSRAHGGSSC
jgi:hypothetical protein